MEEGNEQKTREKKSMEREQIIARGENGRNRRKRQKKERKKFGVVKIELFFLSIPHEVDEKERG